MHVAHQKQQPTAQLSVSDERQVQAYADSLGVSLEEACTQLARHAMRSFALRRPPSRVLPFQRKAKQ